MFVATVNGRFAGLLHLVTKRQGTIKISPLIVTPSSRGRFGLGRVLVRFAEDYARRHRARQIFCTVAEDETDVVAFYKQYGFIDAGASQNQYRSGIYEHLLYKNLPTEPTPLEGRQISVHDYSEEHLEQVKEYIIDSKLDSDFSCIDSAWTNALFDGFSRRHLADVNVKYRYIYLAFDRSHNIVGLCAATPKKGSPIKLMPVLASSLASFTTLLTEVPWALRHQGRKVYVHLVADVGQTTALQSLDWQLDALLPGAYHPDKVTQQWSRDMRDHGRKLLVKRRFYDMILSGKKKLEVRVGYSAIKSIRPGETLKLVSGESSKAVLVGDVRRYENFREMLRHENPTLIAPDAKGDVLNVLQGIYSPEKERLGVYVFELSPDGEDAPSRVGTSNRSAFDSSILTPAGGLPTQKDVNNSNPTECA